MDFRPGRNPELFSLKNDINESKDLYAEKKAIAAKLGALYNEWKDALPPASWINVKKLMPGNREE